MQNPDFFGNLRDLRPLAEACHAKGVLLIAVVTEIVSLGLIESPGAMGADIVVAEGQSHRQWPEFRRALSSACSPPAKNICARCRAGCAARPSMPRAAAASC